MLKRPAMYAAGLVYYLVINIQSLFSQAFYVNIPFSLIIVYICVSKLKFNADDEVKIARNKNLQGEMHHDKCN